MFGPVEQMFAALVGKPDPFEQELGNELVCAVGDGVEGATLDQFVDELFGAFVDGAAELADLPR